MKIVVISDTHGRHADLGVLSGDILIHCGDVEHLFEPNVDAIRNIDDWFGRQQFQHILCIGGNHDRALQKQNRFWRTPFRNARYLQDASFVHKGITFYGAPWVPMLDHHAFFADDAKLKTAWSRIPDTVDVLITHTPPAGILDKSSSGLVLGCTHLAQRLQHLQPKLHCFGHVHASAGVQQIGETTYVNAASVNSRFQIAHDPFVFHIDDR